MLTAPETKIRVGVLGGPPGSGKSLQLLDEAASKPARYLFAAPTIDLIEEQAERLRERNRGLAVVPIHSSSGERAPVARQIADLLLRPMDQHVAALITHEALMSVDLSGFHGWHARIDEPPNSVTSGVIDIAESVAYFSSNFDLDPVGGGSGWANLKPRGADVAWKKLSKDSLVSKLTDFHKLAARPQGLFIKLTDWVEAQQGSISWFAAWTPLQLRAFDSIVIAGAGYLTSVGHIVARDLFSEEIDFIHVSTSTTRSAQPDVTIYYFTDGHQGSTSFWATDEGKSSLVSVCKWFEREQRKVGFWTGNEIVCTLFHDRLDGERTKPKVAGLNRLRDHRSCAIFYSSKAVPDDRALNHLLPISDDEIRLAREDEDIFQFVFRGGIRNPDFADPYEIYLYSLDQAERLRERLIESGLLNVVLVPVPEAGVMSVGRESKRGRRRTLTAAEKAVKEQRKKEKAKLRQRGFRERERAQSSSRQQPR